MFFSLRVLVAALCAQATFGQVPTPVDGPPAGKIRSHREDVELAEVYVDALKKASVTKFLPAGYTDHGPFVVAADEGEVLPSSVDTKPEDRHHQEQERFLQADETEAVRATVDLTFVDCTVNGVVQDIGLFFHTRGGDPNDSPVMSLIVLPSVLFRGGEGTATFDLKDIQYFYSSQTDFCDDCAISAYDFGTVCPDGNLLVSNTKVSVKGDPHMVGLLGQKIDWAGEDDTWYCLLSDGPDFQINLRLSAPMIEEFPDRQLVSAVSLLTGGGHSLVIEVKDPYSIETDGCPEDGPRPCFAEGGVRILVDGRESRVMKTPGDSVHIPGGVIVSAANLQPECRPFGGDRIWAAQFAQMMASGRSLRGTTSVVTSFSDWILEGDTLAAPTWCAKFLEEGGPARLLSESSEHVILRIETDVATLRVNVGVNCQDLEIGSDGAVLVPKLDFWQTDIGFDVLDYSDAVTGLLGDTSRFVLDDEGFPVTFGLGALHGPVESYRVDGPFGRDFEKMHQ